MSPAFWTVGRSPRLTNCTAPRACRNRRSLLRSDASQDHGDRADEDLDVEPKAPVIDVLEVEPHPLVEALHFIPPAHLPQACQPGLHAESPALRWRLEFRHLIEWQRTRTDEAHLAAKDVPELRQLIE